MITGTNVVTVLAILVGMAGIVVPVLPGLFLCWAASAFWAFETQGTLGWALFGVTTVLYAVGLVLQYLLPGRRLKAAGIGTGELVFAAAVGIVGFFVVPVVGLPLGFVLAIYLAERRRHGSDGAAWSSTKVALRAVALSMGVELSAAFLMLTAVVIAAWRASLAS